MGAIGSLPPALSVIALGKQDRHPRPVTAAVSFAKDISASTILEQTCSQTPTALTWPEFGGKQKKLEVVSSRQDAGCSVRWRVTSRNKKLSCAKPWKDRTHLELTESGLGHAGVSLLNYHSVPPT